MINTLLLTILEKINFVSRYKDLCMKKNDFENRVRKTSQKELLSVYKKIDTNVKYESLDRLYTLGFYYKEYRIEFCSKLHNGLIEPYFFIKKGEEKLYFHRFDFICRELNSNFGNKYNIPIYSNMGELEEILKELQPIYEDCKQEFLKIDKEVIRFKPE